MNKWAGFYEKLFNFREIRYFDIEGKKTGLFSRAMTSPCGKIRIPINESQDDKSQIEEYLREYQRRRHPAHRARHRRHLRARSTCCASRACSSRTRRTPITKASTRACRGHRENLDELRKRRILIDGNPAEGRRPAAADLHAERHRPDLLRDHPAQGQRRLRRRQFQGAVRVDRAGPDAPRSAVKRMKRPIFVPARRGHGLAPGACRPARRHVRARDQQGRLLRAGGVLPSQHPPTGWVEFEGPLRPHAFDLNKLAQRSEPRRGRRPKCCAMRTCACASGTRPTSMDHLVRNADGDDLLFVHRGAGDLHCDYGHLRARRRRLRRHSARHDVAHRNAASRSPRC